MSATTAAPIDDDQLEATTKSNNEIEKSVTKRHIRRNQNMYSTPFANRPLANLFNNNNQNSAVVSNRPHRPFLGLFSNFGNRPFLTAQQQAQVQVVQDQGIPALQDEVQGLGIPQDLQAVQSVPSVQGIPSLPGFHPFRPFHSQQHIQNMYQSVNRPFGGGFISHLPFVMGNAHRFPSELDVNAANGFSMPTYTVLGKQLYDTNNDAYGIGLEPQYFTGVSENEAFAPTGFNNF